ncbi:hypothetical protein AB0K93_10215 [Streptomyces sp. NPDC052676]|uniref:hypothetical protein n=1 Tax=Streptomyces sp. NPDC052676 TaxID=3154953 RepID=UPI00343A7A7B
MHRAPGEPLGPGRLVLTVQDGPGPPPLRFETDGHGRILLRQGGRPLLTGRHEGGGCCRDLVLHRGDGYRSPLPPLTAAQQRSPVDWAHRYARWLEDAPDTPLHDGRWQLARRGDLEPGVWGEDFVRDWPGARLELLCGGGWHGVLPLRPLSPPDAARVKAYRKHAREGTLAPVLLWWVSFLDGWVILDGHDRAVAALAEGRQPPVVELTALPDEAAWRRAADELTQVHERDRERRAALPERQRAAMERNHGFLLADLPYEAGRTPLWPADVSMPR